MTLTQQNIGASFGTVKHENELAVSHCAAITYGNVTEFNELLRAIRARFPSDKAMADAIGISPARLSRAMNQEEYTLNAVNCLRLARRSGESPSRVLRVAGKGEVADLIEAMYGKPRASDTPAVQPDVARVWNQLLADEQENVQQLMENLVAARARRRGAKKKTA